VFLRRGIPPPAAIPATTGSTSRFTGPDFRNTVAEVTQILRPFFDAAKVEAQAQICRSNASHPPLTAPKKRAAQGGPQFITGTFLSTRAESRQWLCERQG